ncbi:MAG: alpha/beta fold hydrolase, partial [Dinoroseobacter sp.]|nr:alpha/beta fold hydrolase [Dinoroseobacter sp.]
LNLVGACSGGVTAALLLAYWAGKGESRARSFTKLVAILDIQNAKDTTMGLFANFETLELARLFSRSRGVLKGEDLQKAFAWLRPNDLIWSYWVNNYLLGKEPPAFDILYWNADTTNLPAALHEDLLDLMAEGGLRPGSHYAIDGVRIDLRSVGCDTYVLAGETDHITPWEGCYQSMQALGGNSEFVLSQSGHVQAIINPPGNSKARFLTNTGQHSAPEEFRAGAEQHAGSWWEHWSIWLAQRSGAEVDAPTAAGSEAYNPLAPAPGTYVHATA